MAYTNTNRADLFPCRQIPSESADAKLIGLYRQSVEGLWLQRVKIPGGLLTADQWRAAAAIAREFTPATPLHLTTRQDVEIHDLVPEQIPPVQAALQQAGLTCLGAAGDTPRNVTVCPCSGAATGRVDLRPLAALIDQEIQSIGGVYALGRKFKITLSCGDHCGQPYINDLGLIATERAGVWGFGVTGAGSLGAKPGTGILLREWLAATDAIPMVVASIRLFAAHGDRANRRKARSRHIRHRVGDETFVAMLNAEFETAKAEGSWPQAPLRPLESGLAARATLTFPNGDVTADAADALGAIEHDNAFAVRIAVHHQVVVFGPDAETLDQRLKASAPLAAAAAPQATIVACPGKRWCVHGRVDTNAMADRIRNELGSRLGTETFVAVSGCPNGCSHPAVADFGLTGCIAAGDGDRHEAFNLFAGGGGGRDNRLAAAVAGKLSADAAVVEITRRLALRHNDDA